MNEVPLARSFYLAEHLGGLFYDRFCTSVDNQDVAAAFLGFAGHEHDHARWYAEWLGARGHALPDAKALEHTVLPGLRLILAPQPLSLKLRSFAATEALAERHLRSLAQRIRDPELRAIVERTIPFEHRHAIWYQTEGLRMLRKADQPSGTRGA
jgi:rubrerythrin